MSGFIESMFDEMAARRRRLRAALGDRGQAIVEFLVLGGLALGSIGLFVRPWMAGVTPWGFAIPFVFLAGYVLIEARRQRAVADYKRRLPEISVALDKEEWDRLLQDAREDLARYEEEELAEAEANFRNEADQRLATRLAGADAKVAASGYDWGVLLWSLACTLLGVAAFVIAWTSAPPSDEEEIWTPPDSSISTEITQ